MAKVQRMCLALVLFMHVVAFSEAGQCVHARIGDTEFCQQHQQVRLNFLAAYRMEIPVMPGATSRPRRCTAP
eukprot:2243425-Amphidinium_carterae.1